MQTKRLTPTMIRYFLDAPYKTLSKEETKLKFKSWITRSILNIIKKKTYSKQNL